MSARTHGPWSAALVALVGSVLAALVPLRSQTTFPTKLLQAGDLAYVGGFRLPRTNDDATYAYGGTGLSYRASNNALLVVGHDWRQWVGEITVPTPGTASAVTGLPTAVPLVVPRDILAGEIGLVNPGSTNAKKIGGTYPMSDGSTLVTAYDSYDGGGTAAKSHFSVAPNGTVSGPYVVGNAGFTAGWILPIPTEWQAAFGAKFMTGVCCLSVIGRTSVGPSVSLFDAAVKADQRATMVLGYPLAHPTLGTPSTPTSLYNMTTIIRGAAFVAGTRSVLFFGQYGTTSCYGGGTSDQAVAGTHSPDGVVWCYDPTTSAKGSHGYPYVSRVWAYDANDLVAVKNGRKNPWDVLPYSTWTFDLPFESASRAITGVAYDAASQRIFLGSQYADSDGYPLIHVLHANVAGASSAGPTVAPAAPAAALPAVTRAPATVPPVTTAPSPSGWTQTWADEFAGPRLDTSKWTAVDKCGDKRNGEQQCFMARAVTIQNGALVITASKTANGGLAYTSGAVHTGTKFNVGPNSRVEWRVQLPAGGQGMWPAIWMFPTTQWPPEIDALEAVNTRMGTVLQTYHWWSPAGLQSDEATVAVTNPQAWHVYAVEWEPSELRLYVDGELTRKHSGADVASVPMQLYMNLSVGGSMPGSVSASTPFPQTMSIDYVRVYSKDGSRTPPPPKTGPLAVAPTDLTFTLAAGGPVPAARTIRVTAPPGQAWQSHDASPAGVASAACPFNGTDGVACSGSQTLTVTPDAAMVTFPVGTKTYPIRLSTAGQPDLIVIMTVVVAASSPGRR